MRKILSVMMLLLLAAVATNATAEQRWGVVGGANYNIFPSYQKGIYKLYDADNTVGGSLGVNGEMFFPGIGMGVDMSLIYNYAQAKLHLGQREIWANQGLGVEKVGLHYLEIPVNLKWRYINMDGFENTLYPFIFAGPNVNILLGHSNTPYMEYTTTSLGLHVGVGVEILRKFQISASHEWGLSQIMKTTLLEDNAHKLRTWHVRATYFF